MQIATRRSCARGGLLPERAPAGRHPGAGRHPVRQGSERAARGRAAQLVVVDGCSQLGVRLLGDEVVPGEVEHLERLEVVSRLPRVLRALVGLGVVKVSLVNRRLAQTLYTQVQDSGTGRSTRCTVRDMPRRRGKLAPRPSSIWSRGLRTRPDQPRRALLARPDAALAPAQLSSCNTRHDAPAPVPPTCSHNRPTRSSR